MTTIQNKVYNHNHREFHNAMRNGKNTIYISGGRTGGKGYSTFQVVCETAMKEKCSIYVFRAIKENIGNTVKQQVLNVLETMLTKKNVTLNIKSRKTERDNYSAYNVTVTSQPHKIIFQNGSTIIFKGLEKRQDTSGIEEIDKMKLKYVVVDEASELKSVSLIEQLEQAVVRFGTCKVYIYNPTEDGNTPIEKFAERDKDGLKFKYNFDTNVFLIDEALREIEKIKERNELYFRIYYLAETGLGSRIAYKQFEVIEEIEGNVVDIQYWIDYGKGDATGALEICEMSTGDFVVTNEYYRDNRRSQIKISEHFENIVNHFGIPNSSNIFIDWGDLVTEFAESGFVNASFTKGDKNIIKSYQRINEMLISKSVKIMSNCSVLIAQLKNAKKDNGVLIKSKQSEEDGENDHLIDPLRYFGSYNFNKWKARNINVNSR